MALSSDQRLHEIDSFLALQADAWVNAHRHALSQDASTRRYTRLICEDGASALLMDAPRIEDDPCPPEAGAGQRRQMGWNALSRLAASRVEAFVLVSDYLRSLGLRAPEIIAFDARLGLALIEDLGEGREFARLIEAGAADEVTLYTRAAAELARVQAAPVPRRLEREGHSWPILDFDDTALAANADLFADWVPVEAGFSPLAGHARREWEEVRDELIACAAGFGRVFTLRDYHAENLLWLPDGSVGLLDFQDAVAGWDVWDMAMLIQDARRNVSAEASEAAITCFLDLTGSDRKGFDERLAVIGTLNSLRIAGVFSRLRHRDGKDRYRLFQPRQYAILNRNLSHQALAGMRGFVGRHMPFLAQVTG